MRRKRKKIGLIINFYYRVYEHKYYSLGTHRTRAQRTQLCQVAEPARGERREARGGKKRCHRSFRQRAAVRDSLVAMKQQRLLPNVTPEQSILYVSALGFQISCNGMGNGISKGSRRLFFFSLRLISDDSGGVAVSEEI